MLSHTEIGGEHFSKHMATTGTQRSKDIFSYPRILSDIDSPTRRVGELPTPRFAESGSRRLIERRDISLKKSLADSPNRGVGESFFDYEYLREFEASLPCPFKKTTNEFSFTLL